MSTSKLQDQFVRKMRYALEPFGYSVIENYRPKWLKTKSAHRRLELDIFIPEAKIAIEVHGDQHFEHIPFFHQTNEGFERAIRLDMEKRVACAENFVHLFELESEDRLEEVMGRVAKLLPDNPFGIFNAKKYRYHKRKQLKHGEIMAMVCCENGEIFVKRQRLLEQMIAFEERNKHKLKTFLVKLSKAPHGEEVYFRNLIERGMEARAIETFMDYGQPLYEYRADQSSAQSGKE